MEERRRGGDRRKKHQISEWTVIKLLSLSILIGVILATSVMVLVFRVDHATNELHQLEQKNKTILLKIDHNHTVVEQQLRDIYRLERNK